MMIDSRKMSRTAILVEGALMVALAFALSYIPLPKMPMGGSISLFATVPILVMSFRHGSKWGIGTALVFSLLQAFQGMENILYHKVFGLMIVCMLFDYVVAYTCIGFAGGIANSIAKRAGRAVRRGDLALAVLFTGLGRYICSVISGILLYGQWATFQPVWAYSLAYNILWCGPDVAIALVGVLALSKIGQLRLLPERA